MGKTKERILETALELFNTMGLAKVKLRTIANELGISQGNLNYHFKKRDDVIEALYFRLVESINSHIDGSKTTDNLLAELFNTSRAVVNQLFVYRFILLDFAQVMRENERIKEHFQQLQKQREVEFLHVFSVLVEQGLMRKEEFPDEFKNLYTRIQILGDSWVSAAEISEGALTEKVIPKYLDIINESIFPYLTQKGRAEYFAIIEG